VARDRFSAGAVSSRFTTTPTAGRFTTTQINASPALRRNNGIQHLAVTPERNDMWAGLVTISTGKIFYRATFTIAGVDPTLPPATFVAPDVNVVKFNERFPVCLQLVPTRGYTGTYYVWRTSLDSPEIEPSFCRTGHRV
jgi:hypothetical protein